MPSSQYQRYTQWGVREALTIHSGLSILPQEEGQGLTVAGTLTFRAEPSGRELIADGYSVAIRVPDGFPREMPVVRECAGRIPKSFHTYDDGTLCLGSPVRLQLAVARNPTVLGFLQSCLVPYLYGYSYFERHGVLPFGELAHGEEGLLHDYGGIFGTTSRDMILAMMQLAGMPKRAANRRPCPCGSGLRVGKCHHRMLNRLRRSVGRKCWQGEHERLVAMARGKGQLTAPAVVPHRRLSRRH